MIRFISIISIFLFSIFGINNLSFSQSLIGIWDKESGPGDPIRYNFQADSTVFIHFSTRIDTVDYATYSIPSSDLMGIDFRQDGVTGWKGIYQISLDSLVLTIEGYWYTGLPQVSTPTSFNYPTTYHKVITGIKKNENEIPQSFSLFQNYPNPFNPSTTIQYAIPEGTSYHVKLNVYDVRGVQVRTLVNQVINPGIHSVLWDGTDQTGNKVSSGVYLYRIQAGEFSKTNKMLLIR